MKKLKVLTIVGTRPEIIRMSRIIDCLDLHCDHVLAHTGQNYDHELNQIFFDDLGIRKPDHFFFFSGNSGAETIGNVIIAVDTLLTKISPEAVIVLGDTNSCMGIISAKRQKIPTFHLEAGNRCFDMRVPEEINRRIVDHTADINLTYSSIARDYLLREGLSPDMIIKTGSPMYEVLNFYKTKIDASKILNRLNLIDKPFFLISAHREENIDFDEKFSLLVEVINGIAETYKFPVIVSTHPRTQKRINDLGIVFNKNVLLLKPLSFTDYNKLQLNAKAVVSDSGTINEEASILNFPALNLRQAHERPEGMEEASVMMVGLSLKLVLQGLSILETQPRGKKRLLKMVSDYNVSNLSDKVLRIIHSYTDYVNRVVWKRY